MVAGVQSLPVIFICKNCKNVIYEFQRVGQDYYGVPTISELSARLGGRCPYCKARIVVKSTDPDKIKILPR